MPHPYRLGIGIVGGVLVASLVVCLTTVGTRSAPARAGRNLDNLGLSLGAFRLTERSGRVVTDSDLAGRVWIASFIFTRCPLSCPRITSIMKSMQEPLAGSGVQLVSISVDPERDTPKILSEYGAKFGADPNRWWFLTGPKGEVYDLIRSRFKLGVEAAGGDVPPGTEEISHSSRIALVNRGNQVVGVYDSLDSDAISALIADARKRAGPSWVARLPLLNAVLNSSCVVLLVVGWILIRSRRVRAHATCMISGGVLSAIFLTSYLVYHYHVGSVTFRGAGLVRLVYLTILLSHTVLAIVSVPFISMTFWHAKCRDFVRHARTAQTTLPIWLYVSVTGVVVYLMLYQLPVAPYVGP